MSFTIFSISLFISQFCIADVQAKPTQPQAQTKPAEVTKQNIENNNHFNALVKRVAKNLWFVQSATQHLNSQTNQDLQARQQKTPSKLSDNNTGFKDFLPDLPQLNQAQKSKGHSKQSFSPPAEKKQHARNTEQTYAYTADNKQAPAKRLWNLRNADIRAVIQEISRETGKNFVVDPRVQGKISIVASTPMVPKAIYQVFLSTLQVLGYSAIPSGNVIKIVPAVEAKALATPIATKLRSGQGDEVVARIIPVNNVNAEELVPILRPLLPAASNISAYGPTNALIVVGQAANVKRIANIVQRVDTTNTNGIDAVPLNYASAANVASTLQKLEQVSLTHGERPTVSIAADDTSNMILLSGNQNARLRMRVLISELDTPSASGASGNTQVIYLHYLRAQDLVPILAGVAESYYHGPVGTVIGTRTHIGDHYNAINDNSGESANNNYDDGLDNLSTTQANLALSQPQQNQNARVSTVQTGTNTSTKPKVEIIAEPNTNSIILNAPPTLMRTLRSVVTKLDIRPAEVLVEALIAEVDRNTSAQLGIQWGTLTGPKAAGALANAATDFTNPVMPTFQAGIGIINGKGIHNLQGIISALSDDKNSEILSTPSVIVLDNHQAQIVVGQEVSVTTTEYPNNADGTTGATPFTTFGREKVALHLYVTPQIGQANSLLLSIDQGNDTLQNPDEKSTTPIVNISKIKTSVLVNSGNILVLGGLIQNQLSDGNKGIPYLSNIPLVGNLFKVHSNGNNREELLVFIRPVIIHNAQQSLNLTGDRYNFIRNQQLNWLRQFPGHSNFSRHILPPWHKRARIPRPF